MYLPRATEELFSPIYDEINCMLSFYLNSFSWIFSLNWISRIHQDQGIFRCNEYPEIYSIRIISDNKLRIGQSARGKIYSDQSARVYAHYMYLGTK